MMFISKLYVLLQWYKCIDVFDTTHLKDYASQIIERYIYIYNDTDKRLK